MLQVKENFQRFISCKSTIDDIHVRLRKAEGDYGEGASGASTADMVATVTDVRSLTHMLVMPPSMYTLCRSHNVTALEHATWLYKAIFGLCSFGCTGCFDERV